MLWLPTLVPWRLKPMDFFIIWMNFWNRFSVSAVHTTMPAEILCQDKLIRSFLSLDRLKPKASLELKRNLKQKRTFFCANRSNNHLRLVMAAWVQSCVNQKIAVNWNIMLEYKHSKLGRSSFLHLLKIFQLCAPSSHFNGEKHNITYWNLVKRVAEYFAEIGQQKRWYLNGISIRLIKQQSKLWWHQKIRRSGYSEVLNFFERTWFCRNENLREERRWNVEPAFNNPRVRL